MRQSYFIILFICLFIYQNTFAYDECFEGNCYSHLNSGWETQGGAGCIKTGIRWDRKYKSPIKKSKTSFYVAINNTSRDICNSPNVLNMELLVFQSSSKKLTEFRELIKTAIDWCWLATNNRIKYDRKNIGDRFVTDNNLEVNLFLFSKGTIEKTFVRLEINNYNTKKNFQWMHLKRQDLTRLNNELSELSRH
jgi:hypothetical protein